MNILYSQFDYTVLLFTITGKCSVCTYKAFKSAFCGFHLEVRRNTSKPATAGTATSVCASGKKSRHFQFFSSWGRKPGGIRDGNNLGNQLVHLPANGKLRTSNTPQLLWPLPLVSAKQLF